jgi:hypothetical protein
MSDDRKKPGVGFWLTVALVAVVVYPLSIGPVIWLDRKGLLPESFELALRAFYWPVIQAYHHGPEPVQDVLDRYGDLWGN